MTNGLEKAKKLTEHRRKVLNVLAERPLDIYDLSDATGFSVEILSIECRVLAQRGLVDWMYSEDEVAITSLGRQSIDTGGSEA